MPEVAGVMLSTEQRVIAWDASLRAVRGVLRGVGVREVLAPVRVSEVALEPFIEPMRAGDALLITSPELSLKALITDGGGDVFSIAQCHRSGERGRLHAPAFHLAEWYRAGEDARRARADVEAIVAAVFETQGRDPPQWSTLGFLEQVEALTGIDLRGDETADELRAACGDRAELQPPTPPAGADTSVATLFAWTGFLSNVSDRVLDPFLAQHPAVHLVDFPVPLAALARLGKPGERAGAARGPNDAFAMRFESYVDGIELANGYVELRDPVEQRARFTQVAGLRAALGLAALPFPERFLAALVSPGLPPCTGVALGIERLLMLATSGRALAQTAVFGGDA